MSDLQLRALARRVTQLEAAALASKQTRLGRSTIDGGAIIAVDNEGTLRMIVGEQFDGTNTAAPIVGPNPPAPTAPVVIPGPASLRIYWDGLFADGSVAPMDFARVLVYAERTTTYGSPDPIDSQFVVGSIQSATGGYVSAGLVAGATYKVWLYTWSQSGKFSAVSTVVDASTEIVVTEDDLATKNTVYRQTTRPWPDGAVDHPEDIGDLWFDSTPRDGSQIGIVEYQRVGSTVTLTTGEDHGLLPGDDVQVTNLDVNFDGPATLLTASGVTMTYMQVGAALAATPAPEGATVQGIGIGLPINRVYVWDGLIWNDAKDADIDLVQGLVNGVAVRQDALEGDAEITAAQIATLKTTAQSAYKQAYAADGRISISDYEPTPFDVFQLDENGEQQFDSTTGAPLFKRDGSMWITRTRDRRNWCSNPSAETDTSFWAGSAGTLSRVAASPAGDGEWALQLVNSGAGGSHTMIFTSTVGTHGIPVSEGQTWSASAFLAGVTGSTTSPAKISLRWMTAAGAQIGALVDSDARALINDPFDYTDRFWVKGVAPTTAAFLQVVADNPNASATWLLDGCLVEPSERLGRYFDGESEGGSWVGDDEVSDSLLDGDAIIRFFTLEDGAWTEKFWTAATIKSLDASVIDRGEMDAGFLRDGTVMPDKMVAVTALAVENIAKGDLINVGNVGGIACARRARADQVDLEATHFALLDWVAADTVDCFKTGFNPWITGGVPGVGFLSASSPGKVSSTPPQEVGTVIHRVGIVVSGTTLDFAPTIPIYLV